MTNANNGIQLWKNGPFWDACNLGADKPEGVGLYFWWGDVVGSRKTKVGEIVPERGLPIEKVDWFPGGAKAFSSDFCPTCWKGDEKLEKGGFVDHAGKLAAKYDAAASIRGGTWRLPTAGEFVAMKKECDVLWTDLNGVPGCTVHGRGEFSGNSIFLPAAGTGAGDNLHNWLVTGSYWASSVGTSDSDGTASCTLCFCEDYFDQYEEWRSRGMQIRAVRS